MQINWDKKPDPTRCLLFLLCSLLPVPGLTGTGIQPPGLAPVATSKALREPNPRAPRQTPALFPSCLAGPKSSRSTWSSEAPLLVEHPFLKCRALPYFCPEMPAENAKCQQGIYSTLFTFGWSTSVCANTHTHVTAP